MDTQHSLAAFAAQWALTPETQQHFEAYCARETLAVHHLGRVTTEHRRTYEIITPSLGAVVATLAGRLRHHAQTSLDEPAVGDWVVVRTTPGEAPGAAVIVEVLPRHTSIVRQAAGDAVNAQVIASNVDTVFVVTAADHDFSPARIERYRRVVEVGGAHLVVVINKSDRASPQDLERCRARLPADLDIVEVSALNGHGVEALDRWVGDGRSLALVGSSGVGKSTLANRLCGRGLMDTGSVRDSDGTGQHTTTRRQLIPLDRGGVLVDTPGMRELQLWASDEGGGGAVQHMDPVEREAQQCRFRDCSHGDEPGCAVRIAVESGDLTEEQWADHKQLRRELAYQRRRQDSAAARAETQKWRQIRKANRSRLKRR